ncbi:MAG: leucine-rich repeat domain-containing protein, partial [Arcobacter sp.]|nr:leucine-rich repeat domain-containing protein [Arcobacter sp.]
MKKTLILLSLIINLSFAEDSFISMCKNPTPEQKLVIKGMQNAKNEYRPEYLKIKTDEPKFCEILFKEYNSGFRGITGANITDISFLKYFTWVSRLNLRDNKITDITPLKYLTNLTKLNLSSNKVLTGVESLEKLPLKKLGIVFSDDSVDLTPIGKIETLEHLYIYNGKNSQILNNLKNIKDLSLLSVDIKSLCDLKNLQSLESLDLRGNNLKSLECIDQFKNLKKLRIERSQITDLNPLVKMDNFKRLMIIGAPVEDITPLAKMKNLESFIFSKTKIKYLSPLAKSKSIEYVRDTSER